MARSRFVDMPELPEVETTVRGLTPFLEGQRLVAVTTFRPDLRRPFPADLAQRLDASRRIVVVAGPGDRRDEDLREIAQVVAGKFDHYVVRRDDSLRGRDGDEVPRIIAKALQAAGVADDAISTIPDEQEAVDAALRMGQPGDLIVMFADALTRTWKQIIRFKPDGEMQRVTATAEMPALSTSLDEQLVAAMEGVVRDERGLRFEREESD